MSLYVTDTHPLVWFARGFHTRVSRRALRIFEAAMRDEVLIYIPAAALWEIGILHKIGHIALREPFERWSERLLARRGFDLAAHDARVISQSLAYNFTDDIFDAAITATASVLDLPLITRDAAITKAQVVEVFW
jgi:PIN domain nuclease of toxin-antitoxin system